MSKASTLSPKQRMAFVLQLLSKEATATVIARKAGVSETTLYRWREEFLEGGAARLKGRDAATKADRNVKDLEKAIAKRDQVIGELTIANRILKKLEADDLS
jgi:Transposase.